MPHFKVPKRPNSDSPSLGQLFRQRSKFIHVSAFVWPATEQEVTNDDGVTTVIKIPARISKGITYVKKKTA